MTRRDPEGKLIGAFMLAAAEVLSDLHAIWWGTLEAVSRLPSARILRFVSFVMVFFG